jgi:MFS-type transporter involved in bile tolerance (Atg22 family)
MGLCAFLLWQGTGIYGYALGYLLMGGQQTARTLATAQGRILIRAANMGIAYGLLETVAALANILAPALAGYLYSQQPSMIYSASLVFITIAILLTLLFSPIRIRDLASKELEA